MHAIQGSPEGPMLSRLRQKKKEATQGMDGRVEYRSYESHRAHVHTCEGAGRDGAAGVAQGAGTQHSDVVMAYTPGSITNSLIQPPTTCGGWGPRAWAPTTVKLDCCRSKYIHVNADDGVRGCGGAGVCTTGGAAASTGFTSDPTSPQVGKIAFRRTCPHCWACGVHA